MRSIDYCCNVPYTAKLSYARAIISAVLQTNFPQHGTLQRQRALQQLTAQCTHSTEHVLHDSLDKTARRSKLMQPLSNNATAHLPPHMRTKPCDPVVFSITTKHVHTILATHANTIHGHETGVHKNTLMCHSVQDQ